MSRPRALTSPAALRLSLALLVALTTSPMLRAQPALVGLPDLPGGASLCEGRAVSDDGSVVVGWGSSPESGSNNEGALWTGGMTYALGDLPGSDFASTARAVSADGQWVVGSSRAKTTGWQYGHWRACSWNPAGILQELPDLDGVVDEFTHAYAVSADGAVIVGVSGSTATVNQAVAVRWANGGAEALGWLPGKTQSRAYDVSDDGSVIVGTATGGPGPDHAFRWVAGVGMTDLGESTTAEAVSADGSYVVGRMPGGTAGRWSAAEGWVSLGADFTPRGVSADGQVVVGTATGPGFGFAVLWTPAGGKRNLIDVVQGEWGHDLGGWTLALGWDVSPDGTQLVGRGKNVAGQTEGFHLALPREPWTQLGGALAGAGGTPTLHGTGALLPGTPAKLKLAKAKHSAPVFFVFGATELSLPFAGGTLVPNPDLVLGGLSTGQQGTLNLNATWPAGLPAGLELFVQAWIVEAPGPGNYAASNALHLLAP